MAEYVKKTYLKRISEEKNVPEIVALWLVLKEAGTQEKAAERFRVSTATVQNWIKEHNLSKEWVIPEEKRKTLGIN